MKKQLLILAIFVLASLGNATKSFGQLCDNGLKPIAGKLYTYSVTVDPLGGTFDWFVTTDLKLATAVHIQSGSAGGDILVGGSSYNAPGSTTATVDITWTSKAVAEANLPTPVKYYLVVKYTTTCSNNVRPWRIIPFNLFQINVENINSAGDAYAEICRALFVDAVIDADDKVTYEYGGNAFYLKVTANNFTGSWTPKVDIAAITGSLTAPQTIQSIEWSLTTTFTEVSNFDLATGIATAVVPDKGSDNITTGTDEFVYIKIVVADGKFEGLGAQTVAFNLSAADIAGNKDVDVDPATCAALAENDNVQQVLKARPVIKDPNPTPFLTTN